MNPVDIRMAKTGEKKKKFQADKAETNDSHAHVSDGEFEEASARIYSALHADAGAAEVYLDVERLDLGDEDFGAKQNTNLNKKVCPQISAK